jgi:hypothetical protein
MEILSKEKIDKIWVGAIAGVLGAVVGFALFGLGFAWFNDITFNAFLDRAFFGVKDFQSRIVTFSMLIDVVLFFFFIRKNYMEFCKGLILVLVLSVVVVAWLY